MTPSSAYEVVWPLNKWDYLSLPDPVTMSGETSARPPMPPTPGRDLATRALVATTRSQERVGAVLGISRRSVGRTLALDIVATLRDAAAVTVARACLANSEHRGSTPQERADAATWLDRVLADLPDTAVVGDADTSSADHLAESEELATHGSVCSLATPPVEPPPVAPKANGRVNGQAAAAVTRVTKSPVKLRRRSPAPPRAGLAGEQLHLLVQQQQRILRRSVLIDCALQAEALDPSTLRGVVADLAADVAEAARTIGAILQPRP